MAWRNIYKAWRAITFDCVLLTLLYFSVMLGMTGPSNILLFLSWVVFIASIALLFTNDDGVKSDIPRSMGRAFFAIMISVLVWHGWFFTGALWLGIFLINEHLISKYNLATKEKKDPSPSANMGQSAGAP
jgi:hypothetical protein